MPEWFQRRQPSSSSHPEEDGGRQGMMACLLSRHWIAWANLFPGELLPVLYPFGFGRNQQCHRKTEAFFVFPSHVQTARISAEALTVACASFCIFDVNIWCSLWYYKWSICFVTRPLKFIHHALSHGRQRAWTHTFLVAQNKCVWQRHLSSFITYWPAKSHMSRKLQGG